MFLVISHLGTSVRVWESNDFFNCSFFINLSLSFDSSCYIVDTANGWDNPDFITNTDFSVASSITIKETFFGFFDFRMNRLISVSKQVAKTGADIVCVNPGTGCDVFFCKTNL